MSPEECRVVARRFGERPVEALLSWAAERFGPGLCVATSFGPQTIVVMHMIALTHPETTIFYLDTGLLFAETHALRGRLAERLGLEFTRVRPDLTLEEQVDELGDALWEDDPDTCCHLRKVLPLRRFLYDKSAWITGVRNAHAASRAGAGLVEWDAANGLVKINPLVRWTRRQVFDYLAEHDLPTNSLHLEGYTSIGCRPCTRPVRPGDDPRSGRWRGCAKTECGIHTSPGGPAR